MVAAGAVVVPCAETERTRDNQRRGWRGDMVERQKALRAKIAVMNHGSNKFPFPKMVGLESACEKRHDNAVFLCQRSRWRVFTMSHSLSLTSP
jgi:hypothetical protein